MPGITPSQTVGPFYAYGLTPNGKYAWNDAFTNNLHELNYHIECSDRTSMHVTLLSAIGAKLSLSRSMRRL